MPVPAVRLPLAAGALALAVALAGCTAESPKPTPTPTATAGVNRGASMKVAAFGGASGSLLTHLGNGSTLQWLQITDSGTAYSAVSTGTANAALVAEMPASWKPPKGGTALKTVGAVYAGSGAFYSRTVSSLTALPAGGTVVLPTQKTALASALLLLGTSGVITVPAGANSIADVTGNPKGLVLKTASPAKIGSALSSAALVYLAADDVAVQFLTPKDRVVATTTARQKVSLVVRAADATTPQVTALYRSLTSPDTDGWLKKTLPGAATPAG